MITPEKETLRNNEIIADVADNNELIAAPEKTSHSNKGEWLNRNKIILMATVAIAGLAIIYYVNVYRPQRISSASADHIDYAATLASLNDEELKRKATDLIARGLLDPDSAKFQNVRVVNKFLVCGEVNAKNQFGGYVGYQPFFYIDTGDSVFSGTQHPHCH